MVQSSNDNEIPFKNLKNFQDMMKPENISSTFRMFIPMGLNPMLEQFVDKVNMGTDGGHLLQAAIFCKQPDVVKLLISKGADLGNPPMQVPPLQ